MENLFIAWQEFKRGKDKKEDVREFALCLEDNLFALHEKLRDGSYRHGNYDSFFVRDPKLRHIHKAGVVDRILHHAIFRKIEPLFERAFIFDSYSSRKNKGTHRAIKRLQKFAWKLSRNNTKTVWILKCDIRKFFDSVDHRILIRLIQKKILDKKVIQLIERIIHSFESEPDKGIPLGNLTSQLFSNVYLDYFDQFIKRKLGIKHYVRYADDFVILSRGKLYLEKLIPEFGYFLQMELNLKLHPQKIVLRKWRQGIDFLGYVIFPHHLLLRTRTKRRMLKKLEQSWQKRKNGEISTDFFRQTLQSYLGILSHANNHKLGHNLRHAYLSKVTMRKNTSH